MNAEVDEIDKPTDEDVSTENVTCFNYVRMSRVRRPLGGVESRPMRMSQAKTSILDVHMRKREDVSSGSAPRAC